MELFRRSGGPFCYPAGRFHRGQRFFNAVWTTFLALFLILNLVRELETAQDLADRLLYNVLPPVIAARLKREHGTIADSYESASVLFADIVGFTPLSNVLSPEGMIALLGDGYAFAPRGTIELKGKGKMETWFLER